MILFGTLIDFSLLSSCVRVKLNLLTSWLKTKILGIGQTELEIQLKFSIVCIFSDDCLCQMNKYGIGEMS